MQTLLYVALFFEKKIYDRCHVPNLRNPRPCRWPSPQSRWWPGGQNRPCLHVTRARCLRTRGPSRTSDWIIKLACLSSIHYINPCGNPNVSLHTSTIGDDNHNHLMLTTTVSDVSFKRCCVQYYLTQKYWKQILAFYQIIFKRIAYRDFYINLGILPLCTYP